MEVVTEQMLMQNTDATRAKGTGEAGSVKYCEKISRHRGKHVTADHNGHAHMGKTKILNFS